MSLEAEMRQVLAEMTLLQYGRTQAFNASGGKDTDRDPRPSGEAWPMADHWAEEWTREPSERTLNAARAELRAWKVREAPAETDGTSEDDWILRDGEGFSADQVAKRFHTTPSRVRGLRIRNEREMEFGTKIHGVRVVPKLQDLIERGMGARQIALLTGEKRSTIQDAIDRHRKGTLSSH